MTRSFAVIITILLLLLTVETAVAATDGTLGATSTGTANITLTIGTLVRVANFSDRVLGTWDGSSTPDSTDNVCVYTSAASGAYKVSSIGNGSGNAFTITNGSFTIAYEVYWNDQIGTSGRVQLSSGTLLTGQSGANTSSSTCSTDNASYSVRIPAATLAAAQSGTYTGQVSFVVEPG